MNLTPVTESRTSPANHSFQAFEDHILPHLDGARRLARQLTRNDQDAMDVVQEAYLRALRFYRGFRGGDARPWLLEIVRNVFYTWVRQAQLAQARVQIEPGFVDIISSEQNPESALIENIQQRLLVRSINQLPALYRGVLVLRELEELPYKEIARILDIPEGTVMSRLSRARTQLRKSVLQAMATKAIPESPTGCRPRSGRSDESV